MGIILLVKLKELWVWIHRVQGPIDEMHCKREAQTELLYPRTSLN